MKYWNKDKRVREKHWHPVNFGAFTKPYFDRKLELQRYDSPGKFYFYFGSTTVWFELEQDAVWWRLKLV